MSKKYSLSRTDLRKIGLHAAIVGVAAVLTYAAEAVNQVDFGSQTPLIVMLLSTAIAAARRFLSDQQ